MLIAGPMFAQVSFTATVDKNKVGVGETFKVSFNINNADTKGFTPPSFKNFQIVGGPNQSTNVQFVNGNMSRSVSFTYYLKPKQEGVASISPATLTANGKTYKTQKIVMEVVKGSTQQNDQNGQQKDVSSQLKDEVFVRLLLDKNEVYQGEQLTATFKLYFRPQIYNTSFAQQPSFTGFWAQDIELPDNTKFKPEIYNGVQYTTGIIKKMALFPQRSGELEVDPMELQTVVRLQVTGGGNSILDQFFGRYEDIPHTFKSRTAKIKVKPLPENKPVDYTGLVGKFDLSSNIDKNETGTDEPITLKITIKGEGNLKMLDAPELNLPKDFEVFDPQINDNTTKVSSVVKGSKSFDYLIIPRRPGEFKLPSMSFSYFDLQKKNYVTLRTDEYMLKVTGEATTTDNTIPGVTKEDIELLGQDIRHIHSGEADFSVKGEHKIDSMLFVGAYASPLLLFLIAFFYRRRELQLAGNQSLMKMRRASKLASQRLKKAHEHLHAENKKGFYDETARAIWGYLGDKLVLSQSELSRERVKEELKGRDVSSETIASTFRIIDACEMALFSPSAKGDMEKMYGDAKELLTNLQSDLR